LKEKSLAGNKKVSTTPAGKTGAGAKGLGVAKKKKI